MREVGGDVGEHFLGEDEGGAPGFEADVVVCHCWLVDGQRGGRSGGDAEGAGLGGHSWGGVRFLLAGGEGVPLSFHVICGGCAAYWLVGMGGWSLLTVSARSLAQSDAGLFPDLDLLVFGQPREGARHDLGEVRGDGVLVLSWLVMLGVAFFPGYWLWFERYEGREES